MCVIWCYFTTNCMAVCDTYKNISMDWSEIITLSWFRTLQAISSYVLCGRNFGVTFVAFWGIGIWSNYVIIVERTCTSESMNPRPCFLALQYRLRPLLSLVTLLFSYFQITKNYYLLSIYHLYHHLYAELVHLYNLPLYWVCWGHKRLFVIWLQGCLRKKRDHLHPTPPTIDKP